MYDFSKIKEATVAAVAALLLTVTAVGAAVGPARAIEAAPVTYALADSDGAVRG